MFYSFLFVAPHPSLLHRISIGRGKDGEKLGMNERRRRRKCQKKKFTFEHRSKDEWLSDGDRVQHSQHHAILSGDDDDDSLARLMTQVVDAALYQ